MIKKLLSKYRMIISYGFFGVLTTLVNLGTYYICARIIGIPVMISSLAAWVVGVVFAYITNRIFVFESETSGRNGIVKELTAFVSCRILSEVMELLILFVFVSWLQYNDMVWKIISNVLVIIVNYIASKCLVFKKNKPAED